MGVPLHDPQSGIGVVISKRIRGKPEYSFAFVQFDGEGTNKFLTFPVRGPHALKHVMYSLAEQAEARIEQYMVEDPEFNSKTKKESA